MNEKSEINNPYRPCDLESGEWFYHEDVIKEIKERLASDQANRVIVVLGNPGSGKTSTLRKIARSPEIIGKNYIPIYLDAREYQKIDFENLLFSMYKDVVAVLNKSGYVIPGPGRSSKQQTQEADDLLESFLLTIDSVLPQNETLLIILDEFDNLLRIIDEKTISRIIENLQQIDRDWADCALILAGNKKLQKMTRSRLFNQSIDRISPITIEEVLAEASIRDLVIQPVKGRQDYTEEALQKIVWLSGKNLYFQQLICYYVFELLGELKQITCQAVHVEQAVEQLLKEERPEFVFAWENYITLEGRLFVSALADESVTEKRGNYYFVKENTLLDDILGGDIHKEVKILQDFGYIGELTRRRFSEFPFKTPLMGWWIRDRHPFIKTIIENIDEIAEKTELSKLINGIKEAPADQLISYNTSEILKIAGKWAVLKNRLMDKHPVEQCQVADFFKSFAEYLDFNLKEDNTDRAYMTIDIKNLGIGLIEDVFCFVQDRLELTKESTSRIEKTASGIAMESKKKLTLFFYFQKSDAVSQILKKTYLNLIPISTHDVKKIILAKKPREAFKKIILERISLGKVSPYQIVGPETTVFYGRDEIIDQITSSSNTSYAVVGARKIGKSSLLLKLKQNPPPNITYIYKTTESEFDDRGGSSNSFFKAVISALQETTRQKVSAGKIPFVNYLSRFPEIVRQYSMKGQRFLFLFDEVDNLIEFDLKHQNKIMKTLRSMSQTNICQFIFSGFKELYNQKRDIDNPLYNFFQEIRLKPLNEREALRLVSEPMESIGISYDKEEDQKLILEYTACHPNLVQFFCMHLIKEVEDHKEVEHKRTIFRQDIENVFGDEYEKYIIDEVYMFFTDLSSLERLILIILSEQDLLFGQKSYTEPEIREWLLECGVSTLLEDIHKILKYFILRFIMVDVEKNEYAFALPIFPVILKDRVDTRYKDALTKEIKENAKKSLQI